MADEPKPETSEQESGGTLPTTAPAEEAASTPAATDNGPEAAQAEAATGSGAEAVTGDGAEAAETEAETKEGKKKKKKEKKEPIPLDQQVEVKDVGPCKKHVKVTIDRKIVDNRLDLKFSELVVEGNVSGFRPGKAPRRIIERRYSKDVTEQVRGELLIESLEKLGEAHKLIPLEAPQLDPAGIVIPKEGPFVYEFDVEVQPEFELPDYKGLKIRRPVKTFTEADVEEEFRRVLAPYGQRVPKPEGNAQVGDYLTVDAVTRDGDRVMSQHQELQIRVEPRLAFKDAVAERFGEQTRGANPGDVREVDITLSDAVADPNMRGRTVQSTLTIKEVKSLRLPELTHELLHQFGVHNEDQLRERLRVLLNLRLEYTQRQAAREQVLQHIATASQWELPQEMLHRQARRTMGRRIMEMRSSGMSEEEIRGRTRLMEKDILKTTALALKEHFVLQKVAEVEKIEVGQDDLDQEIERIALQEEDSPRRIRAQLEKEDLMDALAGQLLERKALDLVLANAEYEDVPIGEPEGAVATVEEQAMPGEMQDPTAVPEETEKAAPAAAGEAPAAEVPSAEAPAADAPGAEGTSPPPSQS